MRLPDKCSGRGSCIIYEQCHRLICDMLCEYEGYIRGISKLNLVSKALQQVKLLLETELDILLTTKSLLNVDCQIT